MLDRFEDDRGVIQDLLATPLDAVTKIFTKEGAVRGNHVHNETVQWTYIVSGCLQMIARYPSGSVVDAVYGPGDLICDEARVAHAWKALKDTTTLVFTKGPRSGTDYESDVTRLSDEERLIIP